MIGQWHEFRLVINYANEGVIAQLGLDGAGLQPIDHIWILGALLQGPTQLVAGTQCRRLVAYKECFLAGIVLLGGQHHLSFQLG